MEVIISTWTKLQFPEGRVQDENDMGNSQNCGRHMAWERVPMRIFPKQKNTGRFPRRFELLNSVPFCHKSDGVCSCLANRQN